MWLDSAFKSKAFAVSLGASKEDVVPQSPCVSEIVNSKSSDPAFVHENILKYNNLVALSLSKSTGSVGEK